MQLPNYLAMLSGAERLLAEAYRTVSVGHDADADVAFFCAGFARECDDRAAALDPFCDRYSSVADPESDRLHPVALGPARTGPASLVRDLADLRQLATLVETGWMLIGQAARGAGDEALIALETERAPQLGRQLGWLSMRIRFEAAQALLLS